MGLFGIKKNAAEDGRKETEREGEAPIRVLGSGCAKCGELEANVRAAMEELGVTDSLDHVTDFSRIAAYGVMSTPALVIQGKVVSSGRVLKKDEAVKLLKKAGY